MCLHFQVVRSEVVGQVGPSAVAPTGGEDGCVLAGQPWDVHLELGNCRWDIHHILFFFQSQVEQISCVYGCRSIRSRLHRPACLVAPPSII